MITIGQRNVFSEQVETGQKIWDMINQGCKNILMIGEPQSGKTDALLYVADKIIEESVDYTYSMIYLSHIARNGITNQSFIRFYEADMVGHVDCRHILNMNDVNIESIKNKCMNKNHKVFLFLDECQQAIGIDKSIDTFLSSFGINYNKSSDDWYNKNAYLINISATPYAFSVKKYMDDSYGKIIKLQNSPKYFSGAKLFESGRMKDTDDIWDGDNYTITTFFKDRVTELLDKCKSDGNGYAIIRARGDDAILALKLYAIRFNIDIISCSSKEDDLDISQINSYLGIKPDKPTIILIRGALTAGQTLQTTQNIRLYVESPSSSSCTTLQRVCRNCGYSINGHSKFDDTYNVYCSKDSFEEGLSFYDSYENTPTGRYTRRGKLGVTPVEDIIKENCIYN